MAANPIASVGGFLFAAFVHGPSAVQNESWPHLGELAQPRSRAENEAEVVASLPIASSMAAMQMPR
jgi:hypothetical protein